MISTNAPSFSKFTDTSWMPLVAIKKEEGDYATITTHNFCDNTTWVEGTLDSTWTISPATGKNLFITSSRTQFAHNLAISPKEIIVEHFKWDALSEIPVLSETRLIKNVTGLFETGSSHYSAPTMTELTHGLTTIAHGQPVDMVLYSVKTISKFAKIVIREKDHLPITGAYLAASFETVSRDI